MNRQVSHPWDHLGMKSERSHIDLAAPVLTRASVYGYLRLWTVAGVATSTSLGKKRFL